jgi:hypothetical protein
VAIAFSAPLDHVTKAQASRPDRDLPLPSLAVKTTNNELDTSVLFHNRHKDDLPPRPAHQTALGTVGINDAERFPRIAAHKPETSMKPWMMKWAIAAALADPCNQECRITYSGLQDDTRFLASGLAARFNLPTDKVALL